MLMDLGSQGKNLFQSPQVGVAGLQKMERRLQVLSLWEWQAESTESAGEGDHSNSPYVLSTRHAPDFRLRLATTPILRMRKLRL